MRENNSERERVREKERDMKIDTLERYIERS